MPDIISTAQPVSNNPTPDPLMALVFFFIVTSIYCVISIFIPDTHQLIIAKICYMLFVVIGEYFINLSLSSQMCGVSQWQTTLFITIIPWVLIFGVLHLFLIMFPGWSMPFSNTFGYLVAKLMGLPKLMEQILVEQNQNMPDANKALESVRTDNSLFINELHTEARTPKNDDKGNQLRPLVYERKKFDKAWDKLVSGGIIKKMPNPEKSRNELYHFVQMKHTISEYIWNLLTGFLVTSISYNYIINTGCAKSPKEMKARYDKYEADEDQRQQAKQKESENKVTYTQA